MVADVAELAGQRVGRMPGGLAEQLEQRRRGAVGRGAVGRGAVGRGASSAEAARRTLDQWRSTAAIVGGQDGLGQDALVDERTKRRGRPGLSLARWTRTRSSRRGRCAARRRPGTRLANSAEQRPPGAAPTADRTSGSGRSGRCFRLAPGRLDDREVGCLVEEAQGEELAGQGLARGRGNGDRTGSVDQRRVRWLARLGLVVVGRDRVLVGRVRVRVRRDRVSSALVRPRQLRVQPVGIQPRDDRAGPSPAGAVRGGRRARRGPAGSSVAPRKGIRSMRCESGTPGPVGCGCAGPDRGRCFASPPARSGDGHALATDGAPRARSSGGGAPGRPGRTRTTTGGRARAGRTAGRSRWRSPRARAG